MVEDMVARTKNKAAVKDTILHALPLTADMMRKRVCVCVYTHTTNLFFYEQFIELERPLIWALFMA
jgi:hypothetical protein